MRQQLLDLNAIQQIDLNIRELEKQLEVAPARLRELEAKVAVAGDEIAKLTEQRDTIAREQKTLEGSVQAENLKIKKWEARLHEIRNQREYLALSREVEGAKRQVRDWEDRILELAGQREQLDKQLDSLHDQLAESEVDCQSERETVEKARSGSEAAIREEKSRREELLHKVPGALLRKYENIRAKRLGLGLATVVDGSCQACNMKLPPQLYNVLQRVESIEQCPSCHRLIFWERILEDEAEAEAEGQGSEGAEASP